MPWVEVFAVFLVCHNVGDYLFQTEWQASNKIGGLGSDPVARRALLAHIGMYTLAFVPALIWLTSSLGAGVLLVAALIALPHMVQDDGRLLDLYLARIKRCNPKAVLVVRPVVDQAFHFVSLFAVAIAAGG